MHAETDPFTIGFMFCSVLLTGEHQLLKTEGRIQKFTERGDTEPDILEDKWPGKGIFSPKDVYYSVFLIRSLRAPLALSLNPPL